MDRSLKINISKQVRVLIVFIIVLVLAYTVLADSIFFVYLIWNIFLAFIPFFISSALLWYKKQEKNYLIFFIFGLFFWLIFFPNAPYLVTDIIHLGSNKDVPILFDMILLFSSALVGVYFALKSLFQVEQILFFWFKKKKTDVAIILVILLSSFGVYLGRYLRWNSWDLFFNAKNILNDIANIFLKSENHKEAYIVTLVFFVFISCSYHIYKYFKNKML